MIINIRGTSGSGKTTVVRGLFAAGTVQKVFPAAVGQRLLLTDLGLPEAYRVALLGGDRPVYVIGSYEGVCGGCDGIKTQNEVCGRVRAYARQGHVVFEGLLISHLYSRYAELDRELQPIPYIWAFLDTPLELCLKRVQARRDARGVAKGRLNPCNTTEKWYSSQRVYAKCQAAGLDARWVDHSDPVPEILRWLLHAPGP